MNVDSVWNKILNTVKVFFEVYIVEPVKNIGIIDIVDIILLTFVLFFIYRFIRERRAIKLLLGLTLVLTLSLIGNALELHATSLLLGNFMQVGVIAILIIFQPELRSALEKVGEVPSTGIRNITAESKDAAARSADIDALCTAVSDMSRDKVGALIVIERTTKLGEYIKSGVPIDAAISAHLIRNLFFDKAPLHDGAVIIRSGRICAAGCFLPLSTNDEINKDLGTRHRAGMGMSEESDAIVIIVSEETGVVSVAVEGQLQRNFNYVTLKQELNRRLSSSVHGDGQKKHGKKEKKSKKKNSN
ncbi:MAG: TIGR00159 family protein [Ruminococcaceae bacterium]|nr:TIGR00159 family protein [Oscillospiraceae bacterium]